MSLRSLFVPLVGIVVTGSLALSLTRSSRLLKTRAFAGVLVAAALAASASTAVAAEPAADLMAIQSPPKPIPVGMTFIDQGQFDPRLKGYKTPDGFKVEIVATEPTIINPVGMTFGPDGTMYVLEWCPDTGGWPETPEVFTYRDGTKKTVATMKKKVKDVLKVLTFNAEKGLWDKAEVILQDELPSSVLVHDGWIYLSGRGTVRRFKQSKPGGAYDVKEVIAQGFCGFHHHQVSGMTIGNDGWLYITSGDDDNFVEGSDGSRSNVLRTGAVFRCRPDGSKMHAYSMGWRNPYRDLAFDNEYNWFHVDNDNEDGSKFTGVRLMHVAEESDFGWRLFPGARCCKPDMLRGAVLGEMPGKMPAMLKTGRGSPAGLTIYNDTRIPEFYRNWLWYPDCFRKLIRAYKPKVEGSTFGIAQEFELMKSDDPLYRPVQMVTGPDGAIYICDWRTDSGGAGKLWGDGLHGRILKMTWTGGKIPGGADAPAIALRGMDSWSKIRKLGDDELVKVLSADDMTDRLLATNEFRLRGDKNRPTLLKIVGDESASLPARMAALGAVQSFWNVDCRTTFIALFRDRSPALRRMAADALAMNCERADVVAYNALMAQLTDPDAPVRRSVILAIGKIDAPGAADMLANAMKFDDGRDRYLSDAWVRAIERVGKPALSKMIEVASSGNEIDRDKVVQAFLAMRSRAAGEILPLVLAIPHTSTEQKIALIRSYSTYQLEPALSLDPLLEFLGKADKQPMEVYRAAIAVLAEAGSLRGPRAAAMLSNLLDAEAPEARMSAIAAIETARLNEAAPRLLVALADEKRAMPERIAILKALRVLNHKDGAEVLKTILTQETPASFRLEALRSLSAIDAKAAAGFAAKFLEIPDAALQAESVQVLSNTPEGAKSVGERFLAKKMPRDLLPQVSEGLRKYASKSPELNTMLTEVMKGGLLLSLEPAQMEKIRQQVLTKGDPKRGKEIYLNSKALQCINCHKMEGIGGAVGPDLTRIWDTISLEHLMTSMIDPSKEIKEGYQSYRLTTSAGATIGGLKTVDKPTEVIIRDASGKDTRVARADIDTLEVSKISLMPDNAISQLSYDQFIDLVSFLKNKDAQESLRGMVTEFWTAGPFDAEHQAVQPPETDADPTKTYASTKTPGKPVAWMKQTTQADGYLNLRATYNADKISAYTLTYVFSPKAQKGVIWMGADDTLIVWIDGKKTYDLQTPRTLKADDISFAIDLKEGWNTVLTKVVNRTGEHGQYMRVVGEGLRVSLEKK